MEHKGAGYILFSSTEVDGTLLGPDLKSTEKMVKAVNIPVIAAGGISSIEDIKRIKDTGVYGVVVGKAIYEGKIEINKLLGEL